MPLRYLVEVSLLYSSQSDLLSELQVLKQGRLRSYRLAASPVFSKQHVYGPALRVRTIVADIRHRVQGRTGGGTGSDCLLQISEMC